MKGLNFTKQIICIYSTSVKLTAIFNDFLLIVGNSTNFIIFALSSLNRAARFNFKDISHFINIQIIDN